MLKCWEAEEKLFSLIHTVSLRVKLPKFIYLRLPRFSGRNFTAVYQVRSTQKIISHTPLIRTFPVSQDHPIHILLYLRHYSSFNFTNILRFLFPERIIIRFHRINSRCLLLNIFSSFSLYFSKKKQVHFVYFMSSFPFIGSEFKFCMEQWILRIQWKRMSNN